MSRVLAASGVVLLSLLLCFALLRVPSADRDLQSERASMSRVIMYELRPGARLDFTNDSAEGMYRVVLHAWRAGSLAPENHEVVLSVTTPGGHSSQQLIAEASGAVTRTRDEDGRLVLGDPVALDFSVKPQDSRFTLQLRSVNQAEGVLVRVYRQEKVTGLALLKRLSQLDWTPAERMARRAGLVHFLDLDQKAEGELLSNRWRVVGALTDGEQPLVTRGATLTTAPPPLPTPNETLLSARTVGAQEGLAIIAAGPNLVRCRADADTGVRVQATRRFLDGSATQSEARGELAIEIPAGKVAGVECIRLEQGALSLLVSDPSRTEGASRAGYYRISPRHPLVVRADTAPLLLRVAARRPVARGSSGDVAIEMALRIAPNAGGKATFARLSATRQRAPFDHYQPEDERYSPTSEAIFHVLVPAGQSASLQPYDASLDVSLAELDPNAEPASVLSYPADGAPPATAVVPAPLEPDAEQYITRRPSNWQSFQTQDSGFVSVARLVVVRPAPPHRAPSFRVARPKSAGAIVRADGTFEPVSSKFTVELRERGAVVLPLRMYSPKPVRLTAYIDGAAPRRRHAGAAERVTTARSFDVNGETRAILVLGDDLEPGRHSFSFKVSSGRQAWLHVPWVKQRYAPHPHWLESEFAR